jgi:hypothetical protein
MRIHLRQIFAIVHEILAKVNSLDRFWQQKISDHFGAQRRRSAGADR